MDDGAELLAGSNPCLADEDGDGLSDGREIVERTNPRNADSDGDGMPDGWEVEHKPATKPTIADANEDPDQDGLKNIQEYQRRTHPALRDSDRDTLEDGSEVSRGTEPTAWDTDGDGMPDGWEVTHGFDPRNPADGSEDADGDSYISPDGFVGWHTNRDEYEYGRPPGWNEIEQGPWLGGTRPTDPDSDDDGAQDGPEIYHGTDPNSPIPSFFRDADGDGLTPEEELIHGTRPGNFDTDGDGICDGGNGGFNCGSFVGEVLNYKSNPLRVDSDGDGLTDLEETELFDPAGTGTTPDPDADGFPAIADADADGDGLTDFEEIRTLLTDPLLADTDADGLSDYEELYDYVTQGSLPDPNQRDTDGDHVDDGAEILVYGTHPNRVDTDRDGLDDAFEIARGTDPRIEDTDRDGMPDGWELRHGLDPLRDDAGEDADKDSILLGLTNYEEFILGTNASKRDTDDDLIDDYLEVLLGLDPRNAADAATDDDGDGLSNLAESILGTLPNQGDTDNDGAPDGSEACTLDPVELAAKLTCTDPLRQDTDADGLDDSREMTLWAGYGPTAWTTDYDGDAPSILLHMSNNLRDPDSDGDGLDDGQEFLVFGTDPRSPDTDNDGDSDAYELLVGRTDPRDSTSFGGPRTTTITGDSDGDGLTDHDETTRYGTDPRDTDSDDDGIPDGFERNLWGPEWADDIDGDGRHNLNDTDADGDTISDGVEFIPSALSRTIFYVLNPRSADSDEDGLLDWEEASNGLEIVIADTPTAMRAAAPFPWSGIDEHGYYIEGVHGLRLYDANKQAPGSTPGRAGNSGSSGDFRDSDEDGLPDMLERRGGCDPTRPDTDGDRIRDVLEPYGDPDRDGWTNCADTNSDNDARTDDAEDQHQDGRRGLTETDPYDADTDDDGLCDDEETMENTRTRPYHADSDLDGASDGLEWIRRTGCRTLSRPMDPDSPSIDWTYTSFPLRYKVSDNEVVDSGRYTFQPYEGPATVLPTTPGGPPASNPDFDGDGLIDGLEDWTGGDSTKWVSSPWLQDTDRDGIADSLELGIYGSMTLASFIREAGGGDPAKAESRLRYHAASRFQTDPNKNDTDGDGIIDEQDINPNSLHLPLVELELGTMLIHDPIDTQFWFCKYCIEPYFIISIETRAGTLTIDTPTMTTVPIGGPNDPVEVDSFLTKAILSGAATSGNLANRIAPIKKDAMVGLRLVENAAQYLESASAPGLNGINEVTISITLGDGDNGRRDPSDVLDLNGDSAGDDRAHRLTFAMGRNPFSCDDGPRLTVGTADGRADGSGGNSPWDRHDDASLTFEIHDFLRAPFLDRAMQAVASEDPVLPPAGAQNYGRVCESAPVQGSVA